MMKNEQNKSKIEIGQILPLVVFMIFAILGVVILLVDGGVIISNRRAAQAAADAGALAGAQRACAGMGDAGSVAHTYATTYNDATSANVTVTGMQVHVQALVEHPSFFARLFGAETLTSAAEARAGCFGVRGDYVLPLAFYCRSRTAGGPFPTEYGCQMQTISWKKLGPLVSPNWSPASERVSSVMISNFAGEVKEYTLGGQNNYEVIDSSGKPPEQIYIIMESSKECISDGGDFECDITGDGKDDLILGGLRGWLYLTSSGNIGDYILNPGSGYSLKPHIWLSGSPGAQTSVYNKMLTNKFPGKVVMIPVFNELCTSDPRNDDSCEAKAHASPWPPFDGIDDKSQLRTSSQGYYHIITFAPFYITCISTEGNCMGFRYAQSVRDDIANNEKPNIIEGFFLSDMDISPDIHDYCSINLGNCTISLSN